jgi:hypothetical protein
MKRILSTLIFASVMASPAISQSQTCSNAILRGTYGFHAFASIVSPGNPATPRAIIGVFTMDGNSTWTASLILDDNGTITPRPSEAGTYIVNGNCTGTLFPNSGGSIALMIVDGGREFYQMRLDPASAVLFGTTKKVSPGSNTDNESLPFAADASHILPAGPWAMPTPPANIRRDQSAAYRNSSYAENVAQGGAK